MLKKLAPLILVFMLVSTSVLTGCGAPAVRAIDLVPARADLVVDINISAILEDTDLEALYDEVRGPDDPEDLEDALAAFTAETGIDLAGFTELVFFGDLKSQDYFGGIAVAPQDVISALKDVIDDYMTPTPYSGKSIYAGEELAVCFLSSTMAVAGPREVVEDVIDASNGQAPKLSGEILHCYNALGDVWVKAVIAVTPGMLTNIPEEMGGGSLGMLQDLQVLGFSFDKSGTGDQAEIALALKLYFENADSAGDFKDLVDGMISLLKIMVPRQYPSVVANMIDDLLDKIGVSRSAAVVTITFEITLGEIRDLVDMMTAMSLYSEDQTSIEMAVLFYRLDHLFTLPTATGQAGAIDFTRLVPDYLPREPASSAGVGGHYTWHVDDQGTVYSIPEFDGTYP